MKRFLFFILFTVIINTVFAQRLTLSTLLSLCSRSNWESVDNSLNNAGWVYYDSKRGDDEYYNIITWSYEKEYHSDKALGWFHLYTYEGYPNQIVYNVFNKPSYDLIKNSLSSNGFLLVENEINDNELKSQYANANFILNIITSKESSNDYYDESKTAYSFLIIKKTSVFDKDNGKKTEYHDNGQIAAEYTLKNGKIEGIAKIYHNNGIIKSIGEYVNGVKNGKFTHYDEMGNILTEYNMVNDKANGLATIYVDGLKSQEIMMVNDMKNGRYVDYYYDENKQLSMKIFGDFINGEKNGLFLTIAYSGSEEDTIQYTNYKNDLKHGECKEYIGPDTIEIANYKNGVLNGNYTRETKFTGYLGADFSYSMSFFQKESDGQYVNGTKEGKWSYYAVGLKKEDGFFLNGKKNGKWKTYSMFSDKMGEITSETEYFIGKKNGTQIIYFHQVSGDTIQDTTWGTPTYSWKNKLIPVYELYTYKDDLMNGKYLLKDSNSNIQIIGNYSNDKKNGTWQYYYSDGINSVVEFYDDSKIKESYYKDEILFATLSYKNDLLVKLNYYHNSMLVQEHNIQNIYGGYKVNVLYYFISSDPDTVISYTYIIKSQDEYSYDLLKEIAVKDGDYELLVNDVKIIEGQFCQNKKCDYWIYEYPKADIYCSKFYTNDLLKEEIYYLHKNEVPYSGKLETVEDGLKIIINIKKGLRDGKTIYYDMNNQKVKEEKYKKGIKL